MNNDIIFASKSLSLDTGATFNLKNLKKSPSLKSARKAPSLVDGSGMASLGLLSLIAACGGDGDGGSPTNYELAINKGASVGADGSTTYEATSLVTDTLDDTATVDVAKTNYKLKSLSKINATDTVTLASTTYSYDKTNNKEFSLSEGVPATATKKLTVSSPSDIFMSYGDISGKGAGDIAVISPTANSNAGSIDIIWDYPGQITDATKTYTVAGDKADIKHLTILGDAGDGLTDVNKHFRFYSKALDADHQILVVGDAQGDFNPRDLYLVWDLADYTNTSATIDLSHFASEDNAVKEAVSQKVLLIENALKVHNHFPKDQVRLAYIDNNDKKDLVLTTTYQDISGIKIIWDIIDYAPGGSKAGTGIMDINKPDDSGTIDGVFVIKNPVLPGKPPKHTFVYNNVLDVIDIDGDGLNDLVAGTGSNTINFIFWGSQILDKEGQGRSDVISLYKDTTTELHDIEIFAGEADGYDMAGLLFNRPASLAKLHKNFWFADVNGDGIRDAISRKATTLNGDIHKYWALEGDAMNNISDNGSSPRTATDTTPDYKFGSLADGTGTKKTEDLLKYGLLITETDKTKYIKKDVNGDGLYELIETATIATGEHAGSHKVWFKGLKFEGDKLVYITNDADKIFKVKVEGGVEGEADAYLRVAAADSGGLAANVFYTDVIDLA